MRILLTLGTSTGGVGTHVRALARDLAGKHTVAVLAPPSTIEHFGLREVPGITPIACEISTQFHPRDLVSLREIRSRIHHFRPDVIHAHGFRASFLTLLARPRHVPVISSWHNQASGTGLKRHVERRVESFIATRADLTLGASTDLADRAREVGGTNVEFSPVAAPTPAPVTDAHSRRVRGELLEGSPPEALLGLLVGRIAPQKNYELLIDIAARLADVPVCFAVAGAADTGVQQRLEEILRATDLGAVEVQFLGPRDDVSALMKAADFYLLTSHWEARALVVQEALLAGLPVVASRVGGIPELLADAGILIDPAAAGAAESFAAAIRELADPHVREGWAERALRRGGQLPDERAVADALERNYLEITRSRRS